MVFSTFLDKRDEYKEPELRYMSLLTLWTHMRTCDQDRNAFLGRV